MEKNRLYHVKESIKSYSDKICQNFGDILLRLLVPMGVPSFIRLKDKCLTFQLYVIFFSFSSYSLSSLGKRGDHF